MILPSLKVFRSQGNILILIFIVIFIKVFFCGDIALMCGLDLLCPFMFAIVCVILGFVLT